MLKSYSLFCWLLILLCKINADTLPLPVNNKPEVQESSTVSNQVNQSEKPEITMEPSREKSSQTSSPAKVDLLMPIFKKKQKTAIIGNVLFASGSLIKYGLVVPQQHKLKNTDIEGLLALLSPSMLSTGLQIAGTAISCMRTSEIGDSYKEHNASPLPKNFSWTLFFSGCGLLMASGSISAIPAITQDDKYDNLGQAAGYIGYTADLVWAGANIISLIYIHKLKERVNQNHLTLKPHFSSFGSPGLSLVVDF